MYKENIPYEVNCKMEITKGDRITFTTRQTRFADVPVGSILTGIVDRVNKVTYSVDVHDGPDNRRYACYYVRPEDIHKVEKGE